MHPFLDVARPLAEQAARRLTELRQQPLTQERKADRSWVTNADVEADVILRNGLQTAFPDHAILTEESGLKGPSNAEYLWVIDPLDGTRSYIRGTPGYSVMVGLLRQGVPYAGVVVDPVEHRTYEALRGLGTYEIHEGQRKKCQVSRRIKNAERRVVTSTGFPEPYKEKLQKQWSGPWLTPINSVGIKIGLLVRQEADLYVNHHGVHYWDTCAPQVILEEAGGVITFANGENLTYPLDGRYQHKTWTLASNATDHAGALKTALDVMPPLPPAPAPAERH